MSADFSPLHRFFSPFLTGPLRRTALICSAVLLITSITACKKDDQLGAELLPGSPVDFATADTLSAFINVELDRPSVTAQQTSTLLGNWTNPGFGQHQARTIVNFGVPSSNLNFGGATLDSIILHLAIDPTYLEGDTAESLTVTVHELSQSLSKDEKYLNTNRVLFQTQTLGEKAFEPRPLSKTEVNEPKASGADTIQKQPRQIRIRLNDALAQRILSAPATSVANDTAFQALFKGLLIRVSQATTNGWMTRLVMNTQYTGLSMYYQQNAIRKKVRFEVSSTSARYTETDFTPETGINTLLNSANPNQMAVNGGIGLRTNVKFPALQSLLKGEQLAVTSAKLTFFLDTAALPVGFEPPTQLQLYALDNDGDNAILIDQINGGYGGEYNQATKSYTFSIPTYTQRVIAGGSDYGLSLGAFDPTRRLDAVLLKKRPSLRLTFTKLK
jgi:hypothetical protein